MGEYKKLENQPLKYVLAEFRFSPVTEIAKFIPQIQEVLRKQYPMLTTRTKQTVQIQPNRVDVSNIDHWAFCSANQKNAVGIDQDRLVFVTAEYPRFEGFSKSCQRAIDTLVSIVEPGLILRIGLRYSDLVLVSDGEKISELVKERFGLPIRIDLGGPIQQYSTDTFSRTADGGILIRTLYGDNNLSCLPDVQDLPILISKEVDSSERMILDFDHHWSAKGDSTSFETADVLGKLAALHMPAREAFWNVTSDYARDTKWA